MSHLANCAILGSATVLVCGVIVLFSRDLLLAVAFFTGWIALGVAALSALRLTWPRTGAPTNRVYFLAAILAISAGTFCYCKLTLIFLAHTREKSVSAISSVNLRVISLGLRQYCERFGTAPAALDDLVQAELCTPHTLASPLDPAPRVTPDGKLIDSSYVYRPEAACSASSNEIVAYEREPWTPRGVCVFPRYGRQAVTRDGDIRYLDDSDIGRLR